MKTKTAVILGNFAPLHNDHIKLFEYCKHNFDNVLVLIPGYNKRNTLKNPFDFGIKQKWIQSINSQMNVQMSVIPINDYMYNDVKWIIQIKTITELLYKGSSEFTFLHTNPSKTDKYKKLFSSIPNVLNWKVSLFNCEKNIISSDIRKSIFEIYNKSATISQSDIVEQNIINKVPKIVCEDIKNYINSDNFCNLMEEKLYFENEDKKFKNYPYKDTLKFNCSDAVVVCNNHILLIQRKNNPGKNVWALPGGFVNRDETYKQAAIRELYEETHIQILKSRLEEYYVDNFILDNPKRNIGIPKISNAFYFQIPFENGLPNVNPLDDALNVKWIPLSKISSMKLFDDHSDIIDYFLSKS